MSVKLIAKSAQPAVTIDQAKSHSRVLHSLEDSLIELYRAAAIDHVQDYTGFQLMPATYELSLDYFPTHGIELPKPPFSGIVSITYTDEGGAVQKLSADAYYVSYEDNVPATLSFTGDLLPVYQRGHEKIKVQYTCGYASAADIPRAYIVAILLLTEHFYKNRSAVGQNNFELPYGVKALLDMKRLMNV